MARRRLRNRWLPIFVIASGVLIIALVALIPNLGSLTRETTPADTTPGSSVAQDSAANPNAEVPQDAAGQPADAPTSMLTGSLADGRWRTKLIEKVNRKRLKEGLRPVKPCAVLNEAAQRYAEEMATQNFFSHTSPSGVELKQRLRASGAKRAPMWENIAAGQTSVKEVMKAWRKSPLHLQNLLAPKARRIGVGLAADPNSTYGFYWVQDFGGRRACRPG